MPVREVKRKLKGYDKDKPTLLTVKHQLIMTDIHINNALVMCSREKET